MQSELVQGLTQFGIAMLEPPRHLLPSSVNFVRHRSFTSSYVMCELKLRCH